MLNEPIALPEREIQLHSCDFRSDPCTHEESSEKPGVQGPSLPTVVVCLAAFNGVKWLPEQLDSILAQAGVSVTVVLSVDRSSDGTEAWIDERARCEPRIVVLPHGERFGGAARNFFRLLRDVDCGLFDYISFSDQDDVWPSGKLLRAHEMLTKTGADAYSSDVTAFWPDGRQIRIRKSYPQRCWDFLFESAGPGCTYVIRPQLACALKGRLIQRWADIQQVALHDWFAYAFARANGFRWFIDDHEGMLYRQHDHNQVGVNKGWRAWRSRASMIFGGWWMGQSALIAELVGLAERPFVQRLSRRSRADYLWLACHGTQCRRRWRDQFFFTFSCLILCALGDRRR